MNGEIIGGVIAVICVAFGGWSLIRLLKERQASDRSYDGDGGWGGPGDDGSAGGHG
jgi:hypothetical protein